MKRKAPLFALSGLFLAITLARVAGFSSEKMGAGVLGWAFAAGLGLAVAVSSYWTRTATTRKQAVVALVFFILVDAFFNAAETWLSADTSEPLVRIGAIVYGVFPTAAVALLGWLAGAISRLPPTKPGAGSQAQTRALEAFWSKVERIIGKSLQDQPAPVATQAPQEQPDPLPFKCPLCPAAFGSQKAANGHMVAHVAERRNGHKKVEADHA
jgi:hypothetical protein